jgi:pyruvate kinase
LVYTGELSSKLSFDIQVNDGKYTLSVGYHEGEAEHWKFVNYGVKGTKRGISQRDFSFKNSFPSRKMTDAIEQWIQKRGIQVRNVKHSISDYERKRENLQDKTRQDAYLLAKIIKMYGIKPRNYMEKAAADTFNANFASAVTTAIGKDIKIFIKSWQ